MRRVMSAAAALVVAGVIALPFMVGTSAGKPHSGLVFTSGPATTVPAAPHPATPTTVAPATTVPTPQSATTTVAPARQPAATTTTTAVVCRNSYNPTCGPFRWSPAPATDQPTVSIQVSPSNPTAGQPVQFTVTVSSADTAVYTCGQVTFGDGTGQGCSALSNSPNCQVRYGPWDPPAKQADTASTSYPYSYHNPGTFTFSVSYPVGNQCYDPYKAQATGSVTFTVWPASTTTTSNSAAH